MTTTFPSISEMIRHMVLAMVMGTLLMNQVLILEQVAPEQLADASEPITYAVFGVVLYGLLPILRNLGRDTLAAIGRRIGGETA